MPDLIFPLRAIAIQGLCLLVAIAIEALVLQKRLDLTPRGSVQYATTLNLFSTVIGWMSFFVIQPLLPQPLQMQALSYIFFGHFFTATVGSGIPPSSLTTMAIVLAFATFSLTFVFEKILLSTLINLLATTAATVAGDSNDVNAYRQLRYQLSWTAQLRSSALLTANACSYGAILVLLLILRSPGI
jgi:hypothetical protein